MLSLTPIGLVRSPFVALAEAPRQPYAARGVAGQIELVPGRHLEDAIADLEAWEYLWVLSWLHRARRYRPKVRPPRSDGRRRGVLATRSPHRPNPLGLSVVRLVAVRGLVLDVEDLDLVDGTPVLDVKPYLPWADVVPATGPGWLRPLVPGADPEPGFAVRWSALCEEQLAFLAGEGVDDLRRSIEQRLALGPQPHAYRRIRVVGDKRVLAYKCWRFTFRVEGRVLAVESVSSGYRARELADGGNAELALHARFTARYPATG
jgi:tRNA-Thr(GGU) m(6)t(6)A37 methyltransferase TsaA